MSNIRSLKDIKRLALPTTDNSNINSNNIYNKKISLINNNNNNNTNLKDLLINKTNINSIKLAEKINKNTKKLCDTMLNLTYLEKFAEESKSQLADLINDLLSPNEADEEFKVIKNYDNKIIEKSAKAELSVSRAANVNYTGSTSKNRNNNPFINSNNSNNYISNNPFRVNNDSNINNPFLNTRENGNANNEYSSGRIRNPFLDN